MKIKQFQYSSDNLSYLVYGKTSALAIDGGAVEAILSFIDAHGLQLDFVANTHSHPDHTMGTKDLVDRSGAEYLENRTLRENKGLELEGKRVEVFHTPGHTKDSLCFYTGDTLISGDTLFNGTIGNCFSGDIDAFFKSLKMLVSLPDETVVYAGHDYLEASIEFARMLEPDNKDIDIFLEKYDSGHVYSVLSDEKKVNPYLRFNDEKMTDILRKRGLSVETEADRWKSLMSI